jgi:D-glycero-alpha-D-manno-heptose 1-phosphate guanylyltransferase
MCECIILAGGFGTRLQSVVRDLPKCLAPIGDNPFLHYLFLYLEKQQVTNVILSLGYQHEQVLEWLNHYSGTIQVDYVVETVPLGTGGGLKFALQKANKEHVIVVNGDTLFSVSIDRLLAEHRSGGYEVTLALKPMTDFDRYGSVVLEEGVIKRFEEKSYKSHGLINGGVFVVKREICAHYPDKFSFEKEYLEPNVEKGIIGGSVDNGYFIDIGIPSDYERAQWEIPQKV